MKLTTAHGKTVFSQNDEDGIIETIIGVIGEGRKTFIEIGVGDGLECNCMNLRKNHGWTGIMIDCQFENADVNKKFITAENVRDVIQECGGVEHPDVFSLDIDGNDWWVLSQIGVYRPRILVCEYNAHFTNDECMAVSYDPQSMWKFSRYYGASALAMMRLGNIMGLSLVYANAVNMFFVDQKYKPLFDNADDLGSMQIVKWSHPDDKRMVNMIDPFSVKDWTIRL